MTMTSGCSSTLKGSGESPAIVKNIHSKDIKNVSINGWGPGASGNFIEFLYSPFGPAQAEDLLNGLQHGTTFTMSKNSHMAESTGGDEWLVFHLTNGHMLAVKTAMKDFFRVTLANQQHGTLIKVTNKPAEKAYSKMLESNLNTSSQMPTSLKNLSSADVQTMAIDGNRNNTWLHKPLPAKSPTVSSIVSVLKQSPVVAERDVNQRNTVGFHSHWRTNSISLSLKLNNGTTIHIIGPYETIQTSKNKGIALAFRVTVATENSMKTLFIKDTTKRIAEYWNELNLNEK
ncbi:hypothetical protein [Alicyclobacillus sp. SO9]|uniref:hypothetical protein n=1 Tax=Alicyclobacillus sp. SO9 TaxID=2665646 RepID=UPI0018E85AE6|nr:hypothetical protein [Alicyclobacillus sp. SO9]QQE77113.1 hypothetical protein GI364_14130 [Alicyclobacillus sp. SO9]